MKTKDSDSGCLQRAQGHHYLAVRGQKKLEQDGTLRQMAPDYLSSTARSLDVVFSWGLGILRVLEHPRNAENGFPAQADTRGNSSQLWCIYYIPGMPHHTGSISEF